MSKLNSFIICQEVKRDGDSVTLVNPVSRLHKEGEVLVLPKLAIYANLKDPIKNVKYKLVLQTDHSLPQLISESAYDSEHNPANLTIELRDVVIKDVGQYVFQLYEDSTLLGSTSIEVV